MRLLRLIPLLLVVVPSLAAAQTPEPYVSPWSQGIGYGRGLVRHTLVYGSTLATGDTARVRISIVNVADSVAEVPAFECGVSMGGSVALRPLDGRPAGPCGAVVTHRLAPGDSLVLERAAVVESPPGEYDLRLMTGPLEWHGQTVRVVPAERRPPGGDPLLMIKLPVVVDLTLGEDAGIDAEEIEGVVRDAARRGGRFAIVTSEAVAERLAGPGWLHVRAAVDEGDYRVELRIRGCACGEFATTQGGHTSPIGFGATLALEVDEVLERAAGTACFADR